MTESPPDWPLVGLSLHRDCQVTGPKGEVVWAGVIVRAFTVAPAGTVAAAAVPIPPAQARQADEAVLAEARPHAVAALSAIVLA